MSDILLTARCAKDHTWDVYGEQSAFGGRYRVSAPDVRCPVCEPTVYAVEISEPESLA